MHFRGDGTIAPRSVECARETPRIPNEAEEQQQQRGGRSWRQESVPPDDWLHSKTSAYLHVISVATKITRRETIT